MSAEPKITARAARVLLVDDDRNQRRSLAIALRLLGHRADEAANLDDAIDCAALAAFDLVLVDIRADMSGLEIARELRRRCPDARVVLTSAYEVPPRTLERLGFGATAYLPKPFRTEELVRYLGD